MYAGSDLSIDFETRSQVDLKDVGVSAYAAHKSTHLLCAHIKWKGKQYHFDPSRNRKATKKLINKAIKSGATVNAYNWAFEFHIWNKVCTRLYDWVELELSQIQCTLARGLRYGMCGKLEGDAEFFKGPQKDSEGHRVMLQLTKPRKARKDENPNYVHWFNDQEKLATNARYCKKDVKVESYLQDIYPPLSEREQAIFDIDKRMGVSGLHIDVKLCEGAIKINDANFAAQVQRLPKDTKKYFDRLSQRDRVKQYLNDILPPEEQLENMQAQTLKEAVKLCSVKKAKRVIQCYMEQGGAAVEKYRVALAHQVNGVVQHTIQYCGASNTGRWAGRGIQPQNMNRPLCAYDPKAVKVIQSGSYKAAYKFAQKRCKDGKGNHIKLTVSEFIKSYIRSMIIPPKGKAFSVNDYSAIEARLVFWFCLSDNGIQLYKDGKDAYKHLATAIYDIDFDEVDGDQRFVGKQGVLGLGYGMGADAFVRQCAKFGVSIPTGLAYKSVNAYRKEFKDVPDMWRLLEKTVKYLLLNGIDNVWVEAGKVSYMWDKTNMYCKLPSGTVLTYHKMTINDEDELEYYTTPKQGARKMMKRTIWGGTFLENICQAFARDIMADAMLKLDRAGFACVLTVHDELINVINKLKDHKAVQKIIRKKAKWYKSFPLEIEGEAVERYQKI